MARLDDRVVRVMSMKTAQRRTPEDVGAELGVATVDVIDALRSLEYRDLVHQHDDGSWSLTSAGNARRNDLTTEYARESHWDDRGLELAALVASWSRDPSTRCGCAIFRPDKTVASIGFNGFPRRVIDAPDRYEDRTTKYEMVVHAEANAILAAHSRLDGCTAYVYPLPPCSSCAGMLIQAGVARVVAPEPSDDLVARWGSSLRIARVMLGEAGVELVLVAGR